MSAPKVGLGQKRIQQPVSELFKDANFPFFFDESVKAELKPVMQKVYLNSGSTLTNLEVVRTEQFKPTAVYCIVPDGRPDLTKSAKDQIGDKALVLSPRWITYCIDRNSIIPYKKIKERAMVNLLPVELKTPFNDLNEIKIAIRKDNFDLDRGATLEAMAEILGFTVVTSISRL